MLRWSSTDTSPRITCCRCAAEYVRCWRRRSQPASRASPACWEPAGSTCSAPARVSPQSAADFHANKSKSQTNAPSFQVANTSYGRVRRWRRCTAEGHRSPPLFMGARLILVNIPDMRGKHIKGVLVWINGVSASSGDELQPGAERLLPSAAAGAHRCVPTHEDAQEDPGTSVVRVLRHLRPDGAPHLHRKASLLVFVIPRKIYQHLGGNDCLLSGGGGFTTWLTASKSVFRKKRSDVSDDLWERGSVYICENGCRPLLFVDSHQTEGNVSSEALAESQNEDLVYPSAFIKPKTGSWNVSEIKRFKNDFLSIFLSKFGRLILIRRVSAPSHVLSPKRQKFILGKWSHVSSLEHCRSLRSSFLHRWGCFLCVVQR